MIYLPLKKRVSVSRVGETCNNIEILSHGFLKLGEMIGAIGVKNIVGAYPQWE